MTLPLTAVHAVYAMVLTGCAAPSVHPDVAVMALPAYWSGAKHGTEIDGAWWRGFGSAELDALVQAAQRQSLDLAAAVARVQQAEAAARSTGASLLPTLSARLDGTREGRLGGHATVAGTTMGAGLTVSYETDFWSRNSAAQARELASVRASRYDHEALRLSLTAAVTSAWLQAVALRERIDIGQRNLASAIRVQTLVASRWRAGAAAPLELTQQRGLVAAQQRALAALVQREADARTAMALLLGQAGAPTVVTDSLDALIMPAIGAGVPAQLLSRRPDLARAYAQLAAADADVAVARAAMLPTITLTANAGGSGARLRTAFDNPVYALAAGLVAPVFDAGRLAAASDGAAARRVELGAAYRSAIVTAFGETELALNAIGGVDAQRAAQAEEVAQATRALELAEIQYRAGVATLLTLLDAQRTLYAAKDAAVQLTLERLRASVDLYKALGGGWQLRG